MWFKKIGSYLTDKKKQGEGKWDCSRTDDHLTGIGKCSFFLKKQTTPPLFQKAAITCALSESLLVLDNHSFKVCDFKITIFHLIAVAEDISQECFIIHLICVKILAFAPI